MKIIDILQEAVNVLKQNKIEEPIIKARLVLADLLNMRKEDLIINEGMELEKNTEKEYLERIEKLIDDYPLQYITEKQEFMGDIFEVNENVLIPRQDTEILVEQALQYVHGDVLELCTGSGIIAVSIAKRADAVVTATDISEKALEVAEKNAKRHNCNIKFIKSDLFDNVRGKYDLIVANPPYIELETILNLDNQVKREPFIALNGGIDGLDFYRKIAEEANKFLKPEGYLCLEIGYNQKKSVIKILKEKYEDIKCIKDLAGKDRVIICHFHHK